MTSTVTLTLVDGVRIVVPDSLNLITPYVLIEQQDWFEDEIKFVRRVLRPGQKVIDIGASYGVYTLSMAKAVGPEGRVWAFEPASGTAQLLAQGIAANRFDQVVLERSALSCAAGTAQLSLNKNSELNALVHDAPPTRASETVPLVTLDQCIERHSWRDIDFVKIDAEGEEANILKGGERFFAEESPLIQYEVKAGADLHMELVQAFAALGYDSYRLVPGLDLLVSFNAGSTPDAFLLNLFCCKKDRAKCLAERGLLLHPSTRLAATAVEHIENLRELLKDRNGFGWRHSVGKFPYAIQHAGLWQRAMAAGDSARVDTALSFYALSRDSTVSAPERFGALEASFGLLKTLCHQQPSFLRLSSLARVARDYGARMLAVNALAQLTHTLFREKQVDASEPFLAPGARFDTIPPGEAVGSWVLAAVLEELERLSSFSSFYTGASARERLETIRTLGFASAEMTRRLDLLHRRFNLPAA